MLTTTVAGSDRFEHLVFLSDASAAIKERPARPAIAPAPRPVPRAEPELDPEYADFFGWLCARSGLEASDYRPSMFRRRAGACLRAARAASVGEARATVQTGAREADRVLNALLVGVTGFFRDAPVFEALNAELMRLASEGCSLRLVSVGCSNGAELYSCALLLAELGVLDRAELTGVDCRHAAVRAAAAGAFDPAMAEGMNAEMMARYLRPSAGKLLVREDLRAACAWRVGDALALPAESRVEVVLCRNLAIYLDPAAAERLWRRLHALIVPGGLLVVGKAERPPTDLFTRAGPCLFRAVERTPRERHRAEPGVAS